jgi:predicted transposase/invertase (TIGR01784 family)
MSNASNDNNDERILPGDDAGEVVQSPYDRLLSRTLTQKESAQELLRSHLPTEIVTYLKLETLEQADTSFIDANLKRRFADRLFKVEMTDELFRELGTESPHVHVLVLVDHKSASDKHTVIQMLGYMVRIWEHSIENNLPLIPIIPWVIYNGLRPWTVARSLSELIPVPESWKRYVAGMEIPILDVNRMQDSAMAGEPILHITLTLLKYGRGLELADMLRQVFRSVADQFEGNRAATLLDTVRKYVMSVNPAVGENEVQGIFAEFWPVKPEPGSVADQLLTKGRQEGRQEGEIKGEIKLIRTLESILGIEPTEPDLSNKTLEELRSISEALQERIQRRG